MKLDSEISRLYSELNKFFVELGKYYFGVKVDFFLLPYTTPIN